MTDMKTTFLGLLLLTATAISAQEQARTFQLAADRLSTELSGCLSSAIQNRW